MTTIILPGMGADAAMYPEKYYAKLQDVTFAEWPEYKDEDSLEAVAQRLIEHHNINNKMVVGGASLGGMVAIEIAKLTGIKKVILIGSATDPGYINPILQKLRGMTEIAPVNLIQLLAGKINITGNSDLLSMFERSDSRFIKAMCRALFRWEGLGGYKGKVCHIHGQLDKVIYPPKKNVERISGGRHLISMSHGNMVADFINNNKRV